MNSSKWRLYRADGTHQDYANHRDLWKQRDTGTAFAGPEVRAQHARPLFVYLRGQIKDGEWDCWISYVTETQKGDTK